MSDTPSAGPHRPGEPATVAAQTVSPAARADLNPNVIQITSLLYQASRDAGRAGLATYSSPDRRGRLQAAISLGSAAEYLGRAVLSNHDPVLLARRDSLPSVIMLSRANAAGPLDSNILRSVDANTVWVLLEQIDPRLSLKAAAEVTASARNAAVHMALVEVSALENAAVALTTIVARLHPFLGAEEDEYWGEDLADVVQVLKDERSTAIQRAVSALIAEKRAQLESILEGLDGVDRERMLAFLQARDVAFEPSERHKLVDRICPACDSAGIATYGLEEGDPEPSYRERSDGDWAEYSWGRSLFPFALAFNCPVCGLRLTDTQFDAAGIPSELPAEWEDVEDPSLGWEPDEDWDRDR